MKGQALVFESAAGPCSGWFHAAVAPARSAAVLLCNPLGYEALCSHAAYAQIAGALAQAGFNVLRFDYHGTGDSAGGDSDPDRVEAWLGSIEAASRELKRLSHSRQISMFGMRLGATLAIEAATRSGGVDSLVLWAPCATGRAFVREMRAANASHANAGAGLPEGAIEALGTMFTAQTLQDLSKLDAARLTVAPTPTALVIGRDDLPSEGPLPPKLRELGTSVAITTWRGYADMMAEPHEALLAPLEIGALVDWMHQSHPGLEASPRPAEPLHWPQGFTSGHWRETPIAFGEGGSLYGVVTEPVGKVHQNAGTAVLLLNVGGNYHVGCNRIYVKTARELAASGVRVLRFDVAGIGDSTAIGDSDQSMYRHQSVGDVSAAIDAMVAQGCSRIWLLGICSGSYLAFETALQDTRVAGQILLNSRLLEWDAASNGPWQTAMQKHYKSTRYYRQQLLRPDVYSRLVRGQVNVRGIAGRFWGLVKQRLRRTMDMLLRRPPQEGVLRKMKHLSARGVDTFVVMSAHDDGLDYIGFHLGPRGQRMRGQPGFRMSLIEDSDHTFSTVSSQRAVIDLVRQHIDARQGHSMPVGLVHGRVATT